MRSAPGVTRMRAPTAACTDDGSPASVATRERRLSAKSSSPRIARSVTAATSSSEPASAASSSIASSSMRVESTSSTTSMRGRARGTGDADGSAGASGRTSLTG
jgi:hypothetical protein